MKSAILSLTTLALAVTSTSADGHLWGGSTPAAPTATPAEPEATPAEPAPATGYYYSAKSAKHSGYYDTAESAKADHTDDAWAGGMSHPTVSAKSAKALDLAKSGKVGDAKALKEHIGSGKAAKVFHGKSAKKSKSNTGGHGTDDAWSAVEQSAKSGKIAKIHSAKAESANGSKSSKGLHSKDKSTKALKSSKQIEAEGTDDAWSSGGAIKSKSSKGMSYSKSAKNSEMYLGLKSAKSAKANHTDTDYYYSAETNHTDYYYYAKSAKADHTDDAWAGSLDESVEAPHTDAPHTDASPTEYYLSAKSAKAPLTDLLGKSSKGISYTKSSKFLGDAKALKKEHDAGTDAEHDAGTDAEHDAGTDAEHDAGTDDAWGAVEHPMMAKSGKSAKVEGKSAKKFGKSSKLSPPIDHKTAIVTAHKSPKSAKIPSLTPGYREIVTLP